MSGTALTLLALATLALGCAEDTQDYQSPGGCAALYDRLTACEGYAPGQAELLVRCERYALDFKMLRRCGAKTACAEFRACAQEARRGARPERRALRLKTLLRRRADAMALGDWPAVERACDLMAVDPDPGDHLAPCAEVTRAAVSRLTREVLGLRDMPATAGGRLDHCPELLRYAARMSTLDQTAAQLLCDEAELSLATERLMALGRALLRQQVRRLLPECEPLLKRLSAVSSAWAGERHRALANMCVVQLGVAVLGLEKPSATCRSDLRRLRDAATRYQLTNPLLEETIETYAKACR